MAEILKQNTSNEPKLKSELVNNLKKLKNENRKGKEIDKTQMTQSEIIFSSTNFQ